MFVCFSTDCRVKHFLCVHVNLKWICYIFKLKICNSLNELTVFIIEFLCTSPFSISVHAVHVAECVTVWTRTNCCLRTVFTLFQTVSRSNGFRHLIIAPWAFPKAKSLLWSWTMFYISENRTNFISKHKLSPVILTWLSQVYGKMFNFPISWIVLENVCLNNFVILISMIFHLVSNNGRCYCHVKGWCYCPVYIVLCLADVVPIDNGMSSYLYFPMADVIAMIWLYGWCYYRTCGYEATDFMWLMLLPLGFLWLMLLPMCDNVADVKHFPIHLRKPC